MLANSMTKHPARNAAMFSLHSSEAFHAALPHHASSMFRIDREISKEQTNGSSTTRKPLDNAQTAFGIDRSDSTEKMSSRSSALALPKCHALSRPKAPMTNSGAMARLASTQVMTATYQPKRKKVAETDVPSSRRDIMKSVAPCGRPTAKIAIRNGQGAMNSGNPPTARVITDRRINVAGGAKMNKSLP